jgi:4-carboxymuconolactone decarboxylase
MSNTAHAKRLRHMVLGAVAATLLATSLAAMAQLANQTPPAASAQQALSRKQQSIAPIAAAMAVGDLAQLNAALNQGLYAYTGFPRTLNALGELMKVVDARKQRGLQDAPGREPGPVPTGRELLAQGTANQTKLVGSPVRGPLFEFAPQVDEYLKTHLFGDIFARDNLDWQSRELATVLAERGQLEAAQRTRAAIGQVLAKR